MDIQGYLEQRCALHNIRRGDLPALLGYRNSAKALRRYDRFIANTAKEKSFASKLRACPVFAGDEFEQAVAVTQRLLYIDRKTQHIVEDLKLRRAFVPHVWFVYEHPLPYPLSLLANGEHRLRSLKVPPHVQHADNPADFLPEIIVKLRELIISQPTNPIINGPYGKALKVIFWETFDHGFIIDLETYTVIGELHSPLYPTLYERVGRKKCKLIILNSDC